VYATDLSANGTYLKRNNTESTASQGLGIRMGHSNSFLLDAGDELSLSNTVTLVYCPNEPIRLAELTPIQDREINVFASRYLVTGRLLGEGGFGKVLVGIHQETQRQLACKIVRLDTMYEKLAFPNSRLPTGGREDRAGKTRKRWPTRVASCFREFDILQHLSHPNIITIKKVFWSHSTIYMFQELVTGGDLFSFLGFKNGWLNNIQAASVVYQVLKGIEHLHNQDIVHRDLKPDNILMTSLEDDARVVITDFGNARFLPGKNSSSALQTNKYQRMFSCVGTFGYAAPEIHRKNRAIPAEDGYSKSVDMWSIGSITAAILSGEMIFDGRTNPACYDDSGAVIVGRAAVCDLSVLNEDYHPRWSEVGHHPKDFIRRLLVLEEDRRMTASEALAHPWFSHDSDLECLYARSVADWVPREKEDQLVERVSKSVPDLIATGFSGRLLSHETISRHFPPSQSSPTQNRLQKISDLQCGRTNTKLPTIMDDYHAAQFAGQTQTPSYEADFVDNNYQLDDEPSNCNRYEEHSYDANSQADSLASGAYGSSAARLCDELIRNELTSATEPGEYDDSADDDHDSCQPNESLDRVTKRCLQQECSQTRQESVQVQETPLVEQEQYEHGQIDEENYFESYYQTQFPEECRRQQLEVGEQGFVLVEETPPEIYRRHLRPIHGGPPTYDQ
jgi:serine/threonine protein kinase